FTLCKEKLMKRHLNTSYRLVWNHITGNRAEMSPEAAGIAACLMTYSHHACRTECYAMTVHYYRLRDYALQHPECSAIMRIID
ncbi:antirestriction protein, partial [Escherichia coli]